MAIALEVQYLKATRAVREQERWMRKCGETKDGYYRVYGYSANTLAIYMADRAELIKLEDARATLRAKLAKKMRRLYGIRPYQALRRAED
jgi:hypothetical protein